MRSSESWASILLGGGFMATRVKDIVHNDEHVEGPVAKAIERQTAKLPSDTFLWLAFGSIAASATLQVLGQKQTSNFVGQWAPTFLILGLYNKLVKVAGSDKRSGDISQTHDESMGVHSSSMGGGAQSPSMGI
jgi:hypothetical protein